MVDVLRIKRRTTGSPGAPSTLANAELAFNEVDGTLYYGKGNNSGQATSIIPIAGEGMVGPQGPPGPQGEPGISAGRIFYYNATDDSNVAGYKRLLNSPSPNPEKTVAVVVAGVNVDTAVEEFITDPGEPGAVDYPAGTAYRRIYARVSSGGVARLHLQIYVRNAAGVETLARDEYSANFSNSTVALQDWISTPSNAGSMLATDRLVNKLFAQRISGGGTVTVTCHFEGLSTGSHIQTTISTGSVGPQGPPGPGVAVGGTTGQVLTKIDATNYNTQWTTPSGGGSSLVSTDDVAPSTPSDGTLWWDSVSGQLYIYYSDGTSNQWISTSNLPAGLAGGPFLALAGGTLTGALQINVNTAPVPALSAATVLGLSGADGVGATLSIDAYGSGNATLLFRKIQGTAAVPTGTINNNTLSFIGSSGYSLPAGFSASRTSISAQASQTWTDTAQGARLLFAVTLNGTTSRTTAITIQHDGSTNVGGPLSAGITIPPASYSRSIYTGSMTMVNGLGFNAYINAANTSWMRQTGTGTSGVFHYDSINNGFTFNTGIAGAADSALALTPIVTIGSSGNYFGAGALAVGSLAIPGGSSTKSVYSAVLNLTSALVFNLYLNTTGSAWLRQTGTGTGGMFYYDIGLNTFFWNTAPSGTADSTAPLATAAQLTSAGNLTVAGALRTTGDPAVAWQIDGSGMTQKSIAAGASLALGTGSGIALVNNNSTGSVAAYLLGGGLSVLLGAPTAGTWVSPGTPAANQATINYVTGAYRIVNGAGGSTLLCTVLLLSNRPSN